jgi:hypothetical protein
MAANVIHFGDRKLDEEIFDPILIEACKKEIADKGLLPSEVEDYLREQNYSDRVIRKVISEPNSQRMDHTATNTDLNRIVPFKKEAKKATIDWLRVEAIRQAEYPRIPKKVVALFRKMFEGPKNADSYFEIHAFNVDYPPDKIQIAPVQGDAIWLLDLLDRFGGELRDGNQTCLIKRKKKRPALFILRPISPGTYEALTAIIGPEYEHYLQSSTWKILGREVTTKLMFFLITSRMDEEQAYLGIFDRQTAFVLFERMETGISVENVLGL